MGRLIVSIALLAAMSAGCAAAVWAVERCTPRVYKEFLHYEFERNKDGDVMSGYPDENNHTIDATRYSLERVFNKFGSNA